MAGDIGFGSTLTIGATSFGTINSIDLGGYSRDSVDISGMDSIHRQFHPGLVDPGEISVQCNYAETVFDALSAFMEATSETSASQTITFTLPDGGNYTATGFLTGLGISTPHDGKIQASATIKLSGTPAFGTTA